MRTPRLLVALAASSLLLTMTPTADAGEPAKVEPAGSTARWITLITGDRVLVRTQPGRPEQVVFTPTRGSGSEGAFTTHVAGHTLVIPTAAMAEVASGRLDRALFDVTTLLGEKYDDARTKTLPVIVSYAGSPATARARAAQDKPAGAQRTRVLTSIGARSAAVTKTSARAFWQSTLDPTVKSIRLDRRVRAVLDRSAPQIGAPAAWQRGYTGRGVKVAVLDTGVDTAHPDLAGKVAESEDFSFSPDVIDHHGHGTHVASTIAGSGTASEGRYRGVAPDATLLNGKVLDDFGSGGESGIIAGMEWATARGAKIVSMSLGSALPTDGSDPMSQAVNILSHQTGALFVIAAGNSGPEASTIESPGAADAALTVGAVDRSDTTAEFSSRGPRLGDDALKPEISGPGVGIVAARAAGTGIGQPVGDHYTTLSGTSMATPHVAGTAALLAQAKPDWTGDQLRSRLMSTADPHDKVTDQGAGRVDADQATADAVTVDQGEVDFGYLKWPHQDQRPITKTVTYRNAGTAPITLNLTADLTGGPPPRFSATQLAVPAGGQASVDVTVDPTAFAIGSHFGRISATPAGGGEPIVTAFGWFLEDERYDVTLRGVNRDGSAPDALVLIGRPDGKPLTGLSPFGTPMIDGAAKVRVPAGVLDVSTFYWLPPTDTASTALTLLSAPQVTVASDTTVTLDARKAMPANLEAAGKPGLASRYRLLRHQRRDARGETVALYSAWITAPGIRYFATPTSRVTVGDMEYRTGGRLEIPPYQARSLGAGGDSIPVADLDGGPRFTGVRDLVAVDIGTGGPPAPDRVRGKLAIIRHDPFQGWPDDVLNAAQQAGAAGVLLFNPDQPGIDDADSEIMNPEGLTIPIIRTSRPGATELLALMKSRAVTVRITGVASTPFVYDLLAPTRGKVPADPGHLARPAGLARIDETFGAHEPGMPMIEDRNGFTSFEPNELVPIDTVPILAAPLRRTAYVSAAPVTWRQSVLPDFGPGAGSGWYFGLGRAYRALSRTSDNWFVPVANSGIPAGPASAGVRWFDRGYGPELQFCFSPLANGPDHEDWLSPSDNTLEIKRNGDLVGTIEHSCALAEVPADAADYEITLNTRRQGQWWKYSTQVRSTWKFHAAGGEQEVMPVILADLDVSGASASSQVKVGKPARINLGLRHQFGSAGSRFTSARLEISYDGNTWTELPLTSSGTDRYTAVVTHPADQAGNAVHLRLDAQDENGGRLTQEVTRAYGLTR